MDNSIRIINDLVSIIGSDKSWIEGKAIDQLTKTASLPGMLQAVGLPDLHPGRGYPIGAAFFSEQVYPALVGNDIGCGMSLLTTSIKSNKVNLDKFSKKLVNIGTPLATEYAQHITQAKEQQGLSTTAYDHALGTIGGGNHFAELQWLEQVYHPQILASLGIDKRHLLLLVHSGSRGLGQSILVEQVKRFSHQGLAVDEDINAYMERHDQALRWAELNRQMIALRMLDALGAKGEQILDVNHNLVEAVQIGKQVGWLHRKGATPSDRGIVMIPGSRGDLSYLVKPKACEQSLLSLAHGAGRKWQRSECKARLKGKYSASALEKTAFGSRVICKDKELIYEEAPQAYKSIDGVIADMLNANLIELIATFKPVLTFKTAGTCG